MADENNYLPTEGTPGMFQGMETQLVHLRDGSPIVFAPERGGMVLSDTLAVRGYDPSVHESIEGNNPLLLARQHLEGTLADDSTEDELVAATEAFFSELGQEIPPGFYHWIQSENGVIEDEDLAIWLSEYTMSQLPEELREALRDSVATAEEIEELDSGPIHPFTGSPVTREEMAEALTVLGDDLPDEVRQLFLDSENLGEEEAVDALIWTLRRLVEVANDLGLNESVPEFEEGTEEFSDGDATQELDPSTWESESDSYGGEAEED